MFMREYRLLQDPNPVEQLTADGGTAPAPTDQALDRVILKFKDSLLSVRSLSLVNATCHCLKVGVWESARVHSRSKASKKPRSARALLGFLLAFKPRKTS